MKDKFSKDWDKFLNSASIKSNLHYAGLYLAAYEVFKSVIVGKIKDFLVHTDNFVEYEKYKIEMKNYNKKDILAASCLWLKENCAIDAKDIEEIFKIRKHRNDIAHELPKFLYDSDFEIRKDYLYKIRELLEKIETWWFNEVEKGINPDLVNEVITGFSSGSMISLDYLIQVISDLDINEIDSYS